MAAEKYLCLTCDGRGEIDLSMAHDLYNMPICLPFKCPSCSGSGKVSRILFGIQAKAGVSKKSNLEIIELYENAK